MDERGGGLVLQLKDTREEGQYWIDPSYNDVMKNFHDIRTPTNVGTFWRRFSIAYIARFPPWTQSGKEGNGHRLKGESCLHLNVNTDSVKDYIETCPFQLVVRSNYAILPQFLLFVVHPNYVKLFSTRFLKFGKLIWSFFVIIALFLQKTRFVKVVEIYGKIFGWIWFF